MKVQRHVPQLPWTSLQGAIWPDKNLSVTVTTGTSLWFFLNFLDVNFDCDQLATDISVLEKLFQVTNIYDINIFRFPT